MEDWPKKCVNCTHSYTTQDLGDLEYKCRCRKGCNFKEVKQREGFINDYPDEENGTYRIEFWHVGGTFFRREVADGSKAKRISEKDYISALEYHYNA